MRNAKQFRNLEKRKRSGIESTLLYRVEGRSPPNYANTRTLSLTELAKIKLFV